MKFFYYLFKMSVIFPMKAVNLDTRDPAVPLNFSIFLSNQRDVVSAARQLKVPFIVE